MPVTKFRVYNPIGTEEVTETPAPRVADLHGKKVCMLWNGAYRGNDTFPCLQQLLKERFPDADILAYDELPVGTDVETIGQIVKQKGCDVVIGGNGG